MTPEPMTPAECDLRGLEYMPLLGQRLFGSEFDALASDSEWRAGVTLWWAAWTQCPAASLPDNDVALCRLAGLGRDMKAWKKVKNRALHGFILCSDGRIYHETLAKQALVAWDKRIKERERKAQWRAKKQELTPDVPRDETGTGYGTERGTTAGRDVGRDADVPADGTRRDGTVVPIAKAIGAQPDSDKAFWENAKAYLGARNASLIGKWVRDYGKDATAAAITASQLERAVNPVEFIQGRFRREAVHAQPVVPL